MSDLISMPTHVIETYGLEYAPSDTTVVLVDKESTLEVGYLEPRHGQADKDNESMWPTFELFIDGDGTDGKPVLIVIKGETARMNIIRALESVHDHWLRHRRDGRFAWRSRTCALNLPPSQCPECTWMHL